ncbi:MAG TPA: hypothetical protein VLL52_21445 [Anaerolineae bacterium]|nr:hypothetical protein [Anaerolineae bacterium]
MALLSGTVEALLYETLPEAKRKQLMLKAMGQVGAGQMLGLVAYSFIWKRMNDMGIEHYLIVIMVSMMAIAIAFIISLTLVEPTSQTSQNEKRAGQIVRASMAMLGRNEKLQWFMVVAVTTMPFITILHHLYPLIDLKPPLYQPSHQELAVPLLWSDTLMLWAVVVAAGMQLFSYLLIEKAGFNGFRWAIMGPGIMYILLGVVRQATVASLIFIFLYGWAQIRNPLLAGYLNEQIPNGIRATMLSLISMLAKLYVILMWMVWQWGDIPLATLFIMIGGMIIIMSVLLGVHKRFGG